MRGALAVLMMDALPPNTMQTLEGTPALVHVPLMQDYTSWVSQMVYDMKEQARTFPVTF